MMLLLPDLVRLLAPPEELVAEILPR